MTAPGPNRRTMLGGLAAILGLGQAQGALAQAVGDVRDGVLTVAAAAARVGQDGLRFIAARFPERPSPRQMAARRAAPGGLEQTLTMWRNSGRAAGNHGDLYDNRDRGHSRLIPDRFPLLTFVTYDAAAQEAGLDYGLNTALRFEAPTVGNSSTAINTPGLGRSLVRFAMGQPAAMARLARLHDTNHLYVYPAHTDNRADNGDRYPANTPHVVCSLGSSRSDRPFVTAILATWAAYPPAVKALLIEHGLLAATTQMILRREMAGIDSDEAYLGGPAHPMGFDGDRLRPEEMVRRANAMTTAGIPPRLVLTLLRAPATVSGSDFFQDGASEELFTTAGAIARIARAMLGAWRFELRAVPHGPTAGAVQRIHWRVLRGDAARIRIEPLEANGGRVAITVPWHEPFSVPGQPDRQTFRVDIGAFADTGAVLSAPAFLSVAFPTRQRRDYAADGRLLSVEHRLENRRDPYADPLLFPEADWRDVFEHDDDGAILGWTRHRRRGEEAFSRDGLLVQSRDSLGRPDLVRPVAYDTEQVNPRHETRVVQRQLDTVWRYRYDGPDDRIGILDRTDQR